MFNRVAILIFIALSFFACSEESNPAYDSENFTTIFDNNQYSVSYNPIDMVQTPDGGYLILGGRKLDDSEYSGIYLLKADKNGNFVKQVEVDETYVNPVGKFTQIGDAYYFFCMEPTSLIANIASTDVDIENVSFATVTTGGINPTYPSVSSYIDNKFLVQCYDHVNKQTALLEINPTTGEATREKAFSIGVGAADNVNQAIVNTFVRSRRAFPYEVGKVGNLYFFNGFYNFTYSLVFTDFVSDDPNGIVYGQNPPNGDFYYDFGAGFSSVVNLTASTFATSIFYFGENYLIPNTSITPAGIATIQPSEMKGYALPELVKNANVKIVRTTIGTKNVLLYASDTKSKQIGLYYYDEATGELIGSRYLGFSNPFEIASLMRTADDGLAVCATTYVAGRFPRICILKLSEAEITADIQ